LEELHEKQVKAIADAK